jgi:hypothetical protein
MEEQCIYKMLIYMLQTHILSISKLKIKEEYLIYIVLYIKIRDVTILLIIHCSKITLLIFKEALLVMIIINLLLKILLK